MKTTIIQKTENKDPFLQRAIEYWLDSVNELGYQPLFCEWLTTKGFVVKYSIKNTNFEQGKDVVAIAHNGEPHGFQLKGGNISLNRWRSEVKPEIDALIGCAIQHPDIPKNTPHISYLVTNGEIEDSVRSEIVALNEKVWKGTPLCCWTRGDLLSGFQGMAEGILPKDAQTYKRLTDLIFADGTSLVDVPKVNLFLSQILNIGDASVKKEQRRRDIAAAMLYATMIAGPYRKLANHISVVRVMTLLLSLTFYIVDKYKLDDKYWIKSYEIIWDDILTTSKLLESEVNIDGFDSAFTSPFDKDLIPFRKHSAISIIYPLKLSQLIAGDEDWKTILNPIVIQKYKSVIMIWGEASLLPFIILTLIVMSLKKEANNAINFSKTALLQIVENNGRNSKHPFGLLPPYYDIDFAAKMAFGMLEKEFEDNYKLSSYLLKPIIEILVRLNQKQLIEENWKEISFIHFEEFVPDDPTDYYLYRAEQGENLTVLPKKEKSWNELITEANGFKGDTLPPSIKRFASFLPFFISVFPHRANSETIGFLYTTSIKKTLLD